MKIHEYQAKDVLARFGAPITPGYPATSAAQAVEAAKKLGGKLWVVKCQIHAGGRGKGKLVLPADAKRIAAQVEADLKSRVSPGGTGSPPRREPPFDSPKEPGVRDQSPHEVGLGAMAVQRIEAQKLSHGGGVKLAKSLDEVKTLAENALGKHLVTIQTGAAGQPVSRLLVTTGVDIGKDPLGSQLSPGQPKDFELYLALTVDRETRRVVLLCCREGGVEIETVAEHKPELLLKEWIDPGVGLADFQAKRIAHGLKLDAQQSRQFQMLVKACARAFQQTDASLVEVNPAVFAADGTLYALDAKISFDDNGIDRHPDLKELRDLSEEDPNEQKAKDAGLSYVKLDGDIGCLVNGAGLAMATMDIILAYGGMPANFLDVGGGATPEQVKTAFGIILSDPNVKAVLINIFGGILLCDRLASGVVAAAKEVGLKVPLVVRMEGNRVAEGKKILHESGLPIITADSMGEAGKKAVAAAKET